MAGRWQVHKFGGTSVGNAERYKGVADIVAGLSGPRGIVVSAMKGATDKLIATALAAQKKDDTYLKQFSDLRDWHVDTINQLLKSENRPAVLASIESDFNDLKEILRGIRLSGIASEANVEFISGFGEVWSAQLLNAILNERGLQSKWLDARECLIVESHGKTVNVDWTKSAAFLNEWLAKNKTEIVVITGFVASTKDGVPTTLKRNGSDYSGSIFGALLDACEITIWTDVDGVFTADPRLVPDAVILKELSYDETAELAFFGAKVVHPATMGPALRKGIPIWIRNTFNPKFAGTKIHFADKKNAGPSAGAAFRPAREAPAVKGFSAIDKMTLINIEGGGMVGVPGVAERLFASMSRAGVSVALISQGGSEHSICIAVSDAQADAAKKAAEHAFYAEIDQGLIERIEVTKGCSILAAVGDNMARHPGVAGRFFKSLGQAGVNVRAIAQGSSERNISVVIQEEDGARALRAAHSAFYLSDQTLSVGIIGSGLIGKTLLEQLRGRLDHLKKERQIDLRVRGITNSKQMILDDNHIDLDHWQKLFETKALKADLTRFTEHLKSGHLPHCVIIDATASEEISKQYSSWIQAGFHVISPNKKANSMDLKFYDELRRLGREKQRHFIYSTNVGAGLPIIQTLRDLFLTGDQILGIEGVLSGTLSYILNNYVPGGSFSAIVKEAKKLGYTEPDPRDDLSGMDVARKLVILAREIGLRIETKDVQIQSLIPEALKKVSADEFLAGLPQFDDDFRKTAEKLLGQGGPNSGGKLRYVGTIEISDKGAAKAAIQLKAYPQDHAFACLKGSDNVVAFRTKRYDKQPLMIQGPGAGPDVTAAGVFADILRLASYLGAPF